LSWRRRREPGAFDTGPTLAVRRVAWCVVLAALAPACAGGSLRSSTPTLSASTPESLQPEITSIELGDLRSWQSPLDVAVGADAVWVTV
jgi:hypothetical protein